MQGNYQFELTVIDNKGAVGKDKVNITVNPAPNIPPTANAGSDQTITLPTNSITLSGNAFDIDGTIASYSWVKITGPGGGIITKPSSPYTTVNGLTTGDYVFAFTVTDDQGATGNDTVIIKVNPEVNIPPTARAGTDQTIVLPTNNVTLRGVGTDADGEVVSYLWTKISGPSGSKISNPNLPNVVVSNLLQGYYLFELQVMDNKGATGKDTVKLTVNALNNIPPTANAGADKTITLPTNSVTLSGSGKDADGTIISYSWRKLSGPAGESFNNPNSNNATISGLIQGVYKFELKVIDNKGDIGTDTIIIKVRPARNQPPIAYAGNDQIITLPTNSITLSGSGTDTDGTIVSYKWTKKNGPAGSAINNASLSYTTVNGLVEGDYTFELKVTDDQGGIGTDTIHVRVNTANNQPPKAYAGPDQTITLPISNITLSGSGKDSDGKIATFKWIKLSGPTAGNISKPTSPSAKVTGLTEGKYKFQLTVTDDKGATGSSTVTITVKAANLNNIPPTADAGPDKSITLPTDSVILTGSGTDPDGTITNYDWEKISGPGTFSIVNSSSAVVNVSGLVQGVYEFELTVTDNKGATGKSIITVTVKAIANVAPTADAGPEQTITLPANSVILTGSGNDADGAITSYGWTKISGPSSGTINNPNLASARVDNMVAGVYLFELKVTDNNGAEGKDTVRINVNASNENSTPNTTVTSIPTVNAGQDTTVVAPVDYITLNGSASSEDNSILSYSWSQISGPSTSIILSANEPETKISNLIEGTYSFELTVTDNNGVEGKDTVSVTVALGRYAPLEVKTANIYPNPVHDVATLEVNTGSPNTNIGIVITDMSGRVVYNRQFVSALNHATKKINMSNLIKGAYVVTIYFDGTKAQAIKVLRL